MGDYGPDTDILLDRMDTTVNSPYFTVSVLCVIQLNITHLPDLPEGLEQLECYSSTLITLPKLPSTLKKLSIGNTQITELPELPAGLEELLVGETKIARLPSLPVSLKVLNCRNMPLLTELPELPPKLRFLMCNGSPVREIPEPPFTLKTLEIAGCPAARVIYKHYTGLVDDELAYIEKWRQRASKRRIQQRTSLLFEELMAAAWHPRRVEKWLEFGGYDLICA